MRKRIISVSAMLIATLMLSGCLGTSLSPTPKTPYSISGTVYLETLYWGLDNAKIIVDGKGVTYASEDGTFSIADLTKGPHTFTVMTPIGSREIHYTVMQKTNTLDIEIGIPFGFDLDVFYNTANIRNGVTRWTNGATIKYNVSGLENDDQKQIAVQAIEAWAADLVDLGILEVEEVENESDANLTFHLLDSLEANGTDLMACAGNKMAGSTPECGWNIPGNEIEKAHVIINRNYADKVTPFYIGVGEALGLHRVKNGETVMHHDLSQTNRQLLSQDRNYINGLYSLRTGFFW